MILIEKVYNRKFASVLLGTTLHDAAREFLDTRANDLMVINGEGRFEGVLSEGDLLRHLFPNFEKIFLGGGSMEEAVERYGKVSEATLQTPIDSLVIRDPITVSPDRPVLDASLIMDEHHIRRLPVVVEDGRIVGTVSRADILFNLLS